VFGREVLAGLVWRRGQPKHLVGFFPVVIVRRRYGVPLPILVGWTHSYAPLGMPLIDRDWQEGALTAWLDHIAAAPGLPKLVLMPYLPAQGGSAFETALSQRGGRSADFGSHARAVLRPDSGRAGYLELALPARRRKELARQRRRLADMGALTSDVAREPAAALMDFLALEASGWKGRAGTAAKVNDDIRRFVEQAVTALAAEGKAEMLRLAVDGRAIATTVTLRSGNRAWGWKVAYDEAFARYSPGVHCLMDTTRRLLDDDTIACADSCATPDHPMIDRIWRERIALSDQLMSVVPASSTWFTGVCALESARRAAISAARAVRNRLRKL
jgi:hypothetical protein